MKGVRYCTHPSWRHHRVNTRSGNRKAVLNVFTRDVKRDMRTNRNDEMLWRECEDVGHVVGFVLIRPDFAQAGLIERWRLGHLCGIDALYVARWHDAVDDGGDRNEGEKENEEADPDGEPQALDAMHMQVHR